MLRVKDVLYALPTMLQRNGNRTTPGSESQRNGMPLKDRDALLEEKDSIIAELKEQVALLRGELKRKDATLLRIVEGIDELLPAHASEVVDGLQTVTSGGARDGRASIAREGQEKPERTPLPDGYRLVAVASDAWVLVAPRGQRVTRYREELNLRKVALDAREHHQREQ